MFSSGARESVCRQEREEGERPRRRPPSLPRIPSKCSRPLLLLRRKSWIAQASDPQIGPWTDLKEKVEEGFHPCAISLTGDRGQIFATADLDFKVLH